MLPSRPVTKDQRQDKPQDNSNTRPVSDGHGRQFSHHGQVKRDGHLSHNPLPQDHDKLQVSLASTPDNPRKLLSTKGVARKGYSRSHSRPGPKTSDRSKLGEGAPIMVPASRPLVSYPNDRNFFFSPFIPPAGFSRDTRDGQTQADNNAAAETNVKHKPSTQDQPDHCLPSGPTIQASQERGTGQSKKRNQSHLNPRTASPQQAHSSRQHGLVDNSVSEEHLSQSVAFLSGSHGISASGDFPPKLAPEFTESRFALHACVNNHPEYLLNSQPPPVKTPTCSPRQSHKTDMDTPPSQSAWIQRRRERLGIIPPRPATHNPPEPSKLQTSSKVPATTKAQISPDSAKGLIDLTLSDDDDDKDQLQSTRNVARLEEPANVLNKRTGVDPRPTDLLHKPKTWMRSHPTRDGSLAKLENQQPTPFSSTSPTKRSFSGTDDSDWSEQGQSKKARKASYKDCSSQDVGQRQEAGSPQIAVPAYGPSQSIGTDLANSDRPQIASQPQSGKVNHALMPPKLQNAGVVVLPTLTGKARRSALRYNTFLRQADVTIGEAVYGPANSPNRPNSSAVHQPNAGTPDQQNLVAPGYSHFDPRVHWTWEYSPKWFAKKMKEVSRRGNRKSPSRFAQAKAGLQRRLDAEKQEPHQEFPQKVINNPDWLAAAGELREMEAEVRKMEIVEPTKRDEFVFVKSSGFVDE
ncbi:hypothetical protein BJ166DRAFT_390017 [Pestalotiopsis sp. NC0098]|nr:hypothetical protein BJ166DRAFT_390017 [Pestalotiopsis sp. NC0098]